MRTQYLIGIILTILVSTLIIGCSTSTDASAKTVEIYLQALVEKNRDQMIQFSCADWEEQAVMELDAFQTVEIELSGLSCQEIENDGNSAVVSCQGEILATYNEEKQSFPVSTRDYALVQESGEWRMCGYK